MANDDVEDMLDRVLGLKPDNAQPAANSLGEVTPKSVSNESLQDKLNRLLGRINQNNQTPTAATPQVETPQTPNNPVSAMMNITPTAPNDNVTTNIACQHCGSTAIRMWTDTIGVCAHCGSRVVIKQPTASAPVRINIINGDASVDSPYYVMKTNYDAMEFRRKAIINLAAIKDTPTDILDSKFGEVSINYPQFMVCAIHVDGSYSASVGYDRVEQYEDYEQKYDSYLKTWVKQRVVKERTVIDWQPYNGNVSTDATLSTGIKGTFTNGEETCFDDLIAGCDLGADAIKFEDSGLEMQFASPSTTATEIIVHKAKERAKKQIQFPGKHVKDIRTNFSHRIISTKYCIAPEYVMPYEKNGATYEACSFATRFEPMGSFPSIEESVTKNTNRQSRVYAIMSILLSLLSMGLAVVFPFIVMNVFGIILGVLSMTPSIIGYVIYKKLRAKKERAIYQDLLDVKLSRLEEYFAKNSIAPLTAEEKDLFRVK